MYFEEARAHVEHQHARLPAPTSPPSLHVGPILRADDTQLDMLSTRIAHILHKRHGGGATAQE